MSTTQRPEYVPSTRSLHEAFNEEITSLGGVITNVFDDGRTLIVRSVLDAHDEVRPGDRIRAGVAMRAVDAEIAVHPYTFRVVCSNGAIVAHSLESQIFERTLAGVIVPASEEAVILSNLRRAVRDCADPRSFARTTNELRAAAATPADMALYLLPAFARMPRAAMRRMLPVIIEQFKSAGDESAFGLMNALTALARDTEDPETRWELETAGGMIPGRLARKPSYRAAWVASESTVDSLVSVVE